MPAAKPLDVFISSTCYDLGDLRAELRRILERHGFRVRLSEHPTSGFFVDPTGNSIETCKANVAAADAIICIFDRRYGAPLGGIYGDRSATEVEVDYAKELGKPIFYFIRDLALNECQGRRHNDQSPLNWIEKEKESRQDRYLAFWRRISDLPEHASGSNWFDVFKTVVDLKEPILKRLIDRFPQKAVSLALRPDRYVRMTIVPKGRAHKPTIYVYCENVGNGPAINVAVGWSDWQGCHSNHEEHFRGALAEGQRLTEHDGSQLGFSINPTPPQFVPVPVIFCEYENRFGDKYRIEQEFTSDSNQTYRPNGHERMFVASPADGKWIEVGVVS